MASPDPNDKRLFLLDAFALIYRSYFAFSRNPITNSKGVNTSAVYGFTNTLLDLINKENPSHIAVVFDSMEQKTDRAVEHEFYKANREKMPEDIANAIPIIKELLKGFQIPTLELAGYEADDIIGTLAKKAEQEGYTTYMVTPDKDFGQLVSGNIFMYIPARSGKPVEIMGVQEVLDKWDIERIDQVIDMLGMSGDSADNIPGIPGVGPKTAVKLLKDYGSMENLYEHTDKLKGKLKERVEENKEQAFISKQLATIIIDAPVDLNEDDLLRSEPDKEILGDLFAELEFRTIGKRVLGDEFTVNQEVSPPVNGQLDLFSQPTGSHDAPGDVVQVEEVGKTIENTEHNYLVVNTDEAIFDLIKRLENSKSFCFDTETTSVDANNCELVGMSFSLKAGEAYYVPVSNNQDEAKALVQKFKSVLEDENIEKIGQNLKYDIVVLMWYDVQVKGSIFDTMLAHYLIDPDSSHKMDRLAENFLGYTPVDIESLIGKKGKNQGSMRDVPLDKIKEYASEDADITLQLKEKFAPMIKEEGLDKLFYEVETPLVNVLAGMEKEGVALDKGFLEDYSKELNTDILDLREKVFEIAGEEFNMDSPKQLGTILFDKLEIPYSGKKTKTGQYSTNEEKLSKLAGEHEIVNYILDYRELTKLKSTYVDALPNAINPKTGRVHSSFLQTVAATGRLSSNNPNLQNIPIRTEKGRRVRKAFIPRDENYVILSADYSQIELRLVADISKDQAMLSAFKDGQDIHASTAAKLYKVKLDEVSRDMRSNAKMVNFGIIYGISAFGLSQRAGIPRKEAAQLIEDYFKEFPGIKKYMSDSVEFAKENGYAKTLLGRKRYLRDINSRNATVRGYAERNAINSPIQGTAADMIKIAMVNLHKELSTKNWKSKLTLQVHDELVLDAHKDEVDELKAIVEKSMKNSLDLEVPILVEMGTGDNWLEAH